MQVLIAPGTALPHPQSVLVGWHAVGGVVGVASRHEESATRPAVSCTINRAGDDAPTALFWLRCHAAEGVVGVASRREESATRQRSVTRSIAPGTALPQFSLGCSVMLLGVLWEWRPAAKNLPQSRGQLHDYSRRGRRSHSHSLFWWGVMLPGVCGSGVSPRRICHKAVASCTLNRAEDGAPTATVCFGGWHAVGGVVGAASRREQ